MGSLSWIILILFFSLQLWSFFNTDKKRREYKKIFPARPEGVLTFVPRAESCDEEDPSEDQFNAARIETSFKEKTSPALKVIINSINNYLQKNRKAVDFSIIKDITERNSDSIYNQVESASPIPVYLGLCGTLIGIVIGVFKLGWGGGIDALLTVPDTVNMAEDVAAKVASQSQQLGADSITNLLRGIGVAMLTTFCGVGLSIIGSIRFKNFQVTNEKNKNAFFSWIQAELLPNMDNSIAGTLDVLEQNLNKFNREFSHNSQGLSNIIGQVKAAAASQVELYKLIKELDIEKMATANAQVWRELQNSSEQLAEVHKFLFNSQQYLKRVKDLNDKLDENENRTKLIEEMGQYFQAELQQIDQRKAAMSKAVGSVDEAMIAGLDELKESTKKQYDAFVKATENEQEKLTAAIDDQEKVLSKKMEEMNALVSELQQLTAVKTAIEQQSEAITKQSEAVTRQSEALDKIVAQAEQQNKAAASQTSVLQQLLQAQRSRMPAPAVNTALHDRPTTTVVKQELRMPVWVKIVGIATAAIVVGTCVVLLLAHFNIIK